MLNPEAHLLIAGKVNGARGPVRGFPGCEATGNGDAVCFVVFLECGCIDTCGHTRTSYPRRPPRSRAGNVLRDRCGQFHAGVFAETDGSGSTTYAISHAASKSEGIGASVGNFPSAVGSGVGGVACNDYGVASAVTVGCAGNGNRRGIGTADEVLSRLQRLAGPYAVLPQACWRGAAHDADGVAGIGAYCRGTSREGFPPPADEVQTINGLVGECRTITKRSNRQRRS